MGLIFIYYLFNIWLCFLLGDQVAVLSLNSRTAVSQLVCL